MNINCSDGVVILGPRDSGKTTLLRTMLAIYPFHYLIFDVVKNLPQAAGCEYWTINPHDTKFVEAVLRAHLVNSNPEMLILDEADRYEYPAGKKNALSDWVNLGKNFNKGYCASARRTANISKDFLSNARWSYIFRHDQEADLRHLTASYRAKDADFQNLKEHEFLIFQRGTLIQTGMVRL